MELRRKIARLVMTHLSNRDGDDLAGEFHRLRKEVLELGAGGYVIFGGNVDSTLELVSGLNREAAQPLLVASDLERGLGQQLEGGTVFPSEMALGATGVPDLAYAQGWATGREARAAGINVAFAPVADVASEIRNPIIGVRSFGGDPQMVAEMTTAFVRGCQQAGVAATAKHFPGHGDTRKDSHIELPRVDVPRAVMETRELVPFRAAIGADVKCIMTAHVAYPGLSRDDTPATMSGAILTRILREQLGFSGVVVTDALMMGAIAERYGSAEAGLLALEAGADVLLMPKDVEAAIEGLREAVDQGRISEERIDASIERIDALHEWLGSYKDADDNHVSFPPQLEHAFENNEEERGNHRAEMRGGYEPIAANIARRAVTLISDRAGIVPLGTFAGDLSTEEGGRGPENAARDDADGFAVFALSDPDARVNLVWFRSQLEARVPGIEIAAIDGTCPNEMKQELLERARGAQTVLVAVFDDVAAWKGRSGPSPELMEFARSLIGAAGRSIVLAFSSPGLALDLPGSGALVCCYDGSPQSQSAAVECVFGERPMQGRLPVALPPLYGVGWSLRR
jgi:beta-N-acetylhexosaminidase